MIEKIVDKINEIIDAVNSIKKIEVFSKIDKDIILEAIDKTRRTDKDNPSYHSMLLGLEVQHYKENNKPMNEAFKLDEEEFSMCKNCINGNGFSKCDFECKKSDLFCKNFKSKNNSNDCNQTKGGEINTFKKEHGTCKDCKFSSLGPDLFCKKSFTCFKFVEEDFYCKNFELKEKDNENN